MASKISPITAVVSNEVKELIDAYAKADAVKKTADEAMKIAKPLIVGAAVETINADKTGAKSVNMTGNEVVAQVSFKSSFVLHTERAEFSALKTALPICISEQKSICIRADKAAEVIAFLTSLERADLIVETSAYTFDRTIFDAMEKNPVYAGRDNLLACLEETSIPSLKII